MKIKINDMNLKTKPRDAGAIVAGQQADRTLQIDFEIEIPGNEKPEDRLDDILKAVRKVTVEAMRVKKLIREDIETTSTQHFRRW